MRTAYYVVDFQKSPSSDFIWSGTKIVRATSSPKVFFEVVDVLVEGFSLGVSSQKS